MEIIGYIFAIIIGLSLGLIGGGGSILTVPVLVYVMKIDPIHSIGYSLFVVGATALAGAFSYFKKKQLCYRAALVFSIPSFTTVFITRGYLMPLLPDNIVEWNGWIITKPLITMLAFATLMLLSSYSMIKRKIVSKISDEDFSPDKIKFNFPMLFVEGILVGLITGFVGAGGGFLIIPALVFLVGLPMRISIGTSLLIIAINSLGGFTGNLYSGLSIDWYFLSLFTGFALAGIAIGIYYSKYIKSEKLKPAFGWFTLAIGVFILVKEILL